MATSGMLPPPPAEPEPWSEKDFAADHGLSAPSDRDHARNPPHGAACRPACAHAFRSRASRASPNSHEQVLKAEPSGWGAQLLIDLSTVNHTAFFREPAHFTFMVEKIAAWLKESPGMTMRIWSAGCSSGQEPYSMAMVLAETLDQPLAPEGRNLGQRPVARDAQDRRRRDLHHPRRSGGFARAAAAVLPAGARPPRGLVPGRPRDPRPGEVPPHRSAQPDLAGPRPTFPIIFCRNVSIYFAEDERLTLLNRLAQHLRPGAGWPWATARSCRRSPPRSANIPPRCFRRRDERPWLGANGPRPAQPPGRPGAARGSGRR